MIPKNFQGQAKKLRAQLESAGITNSQVLDSLQQTPRHEFMPEALVHKAWENTALPIGNGQTISQPLIVARMTELLFADGNRPDKVLEIGTGSGYQTAVLAPLVNRVYSVERIGQLQYQAKRRLKRLDIHNVSMKHGDGWEGWESKAPFDGIIVTAAAAHLPERLLAQLNPEGGRLVIPVGDANQELLLITRQGDDYNEQRVGAVRFVPLIQGDTE